MLVQVAPEPLDKVRRDLRMVSDLQRRNAFEARRGIGHNVGEITIQGQQNCIQLLPLANDCGVG